MIMAGGETYFKTIRDMGAHNTTNTYGLIPCYSIKESVQLLITLGSIRPVDLFNSANLTRGALDAEL